MKERPILFSGPMVRAILEGRKTMTRRLVKPQLVEHVHYDTFNREIKLWSVPKPKSSGGGVVAGQLPALAELCPYGQVGDRLWVRETWAEVGSFDPGLIVYRADYPLCVPACFENVPDEQEVSWKPSIHMYRKHSRIVLEVSSVRLERVCEADDTNILREGIQECTKDGDLYKYGLDEWPWSEWALSPLEAWRKLWVQINGRDSWDANPWVWVVEFRRVV